MNWKWFGIYSIICLIIGGVFSQTFFLFFKNLLPKQVEYIAYSASDGFMILVWITIIIALSLILIFIGFYFWLAYKDALYYDEKMFILKNLFPATILFFIGASFGLFLYSNFMLNFFIQTNLDLGLVNSWNMLNVITQLIGFCFLMGLAFELPIVLRGLIKNGFVDKEKLKVNRKLVLFGILILSAVITPTPDIFSQLLTGLPLYLLFELSLL